MKTFYYLTLFVPFFTCCDSDNAVSGYSTANQHKLEYSKEANTYPANPENAFDLSGQIYYDISEAYVVRNVPFESVDISLQVIGSIASITPGFLALGDINYEYANASTVLPFLDQDSQIMEKVLMQSGLAVNSRTSLTGFIITVIEMQTQQKTFDLICQYITDYEKSILSNSAVNTNDKKIILTTTSLTRYGFYFARKQKQKPRDRNWDISIGCILAGIDGSTHSQAKAIELFVATGVLSNK